MGIDSGSSDQNTVDKVMGKSFPVGRAHGRAPTRRAVYKKDAHSILSAGGWQRSIYAPKWPEISTFPSPVVERKMFMTLYS